jgi:hypothetical protein
MRPTPIFSRGAGAVAAALLSIVTQAGASDAPQPGLWNIVTTIARDGLVVPLSKIDQCISAEEAKAFGNTTSFEWTGKDSACKSTGYRKSDDGHIVQLHCAGNVSFDATATFALKSPQHYSIVFAVTAPSARQWTRTIEGRRLGECAQ